MWLSVSGVVHAACSEDYFKSFKVPKQSVDGGAVALATTSISEGSVSAILPLDLSTSGDLGLAPTLTAGDTTAVLSLAAWAWELKADTSAPNKPGDPDQQFTVADLDIRYQVGLDNTLSSTLDPASKVGASVTTQFVEVVQRGSKNTVFTGYIDIALDYGAATEIGVYSADITITVGCK
ncbi:hypothetical protein G8770_04640 [Aestuariicella hydrocarbonica]|uniref:Uncharacterized protein n=1 Tax=Pseudomaricurvus hydrocarbonicus TaxID=1470433 RepID=A0A9E5JTY4_9GAMM|nr:hypothetical protein [Aestuariicella hydrocarbonica]NHO64825.1 hypothetical protein [Aestuariicella hydrocarbonica]